MQLLTFRVFHFGAVVTYNKNLHKSFLPTHFSALYLGIVHGLPRRDLPRQTGLNNVALPNPRWVSNIVHASSSSIKETWVTMLYTNFGQALSHDMTDTPMEAGQCSQVITVSTQRRFTSTFFGPLHSPHFVISPIDSPHNASSPIDSPHNAIFPVGSPHCAICPIDSSHHVTFPMDSPHHAICPISPKMKSVLFYKCRLHDALYL